MASTGVNVLRYSALGAGLIYGFLHQSKITSTTNLSAIKQEYKHQEALIAQAKSEYAKKQLPYSSNSRSNDARPVPNDSSFDFEKFLLKLAADNP